MKNFSLLFCAALIGFSACKKEEEAVAPAAKANQVTFDGSNYALASGYSFAYGGAGTFNIDLVLTSSGITYHNSNGVVDSISGIGSEMYFELWTDNMTTIKPGVYTFSSDTVVNNFDISYSDFLYNFNFSTGTGSDATLKSCTLTVNSASKTAINVDFAGMTEENQSISGHFEGALTYYDESNLSEGNTGLKPRGQELN